MLGSESTLETLALNMKESEPSLETLALKMKIWEPILETLALKMRTWEPTLDALALKMKSSEFIPETQTQEMKSSEFIPETQTQEMKSSEPSLVTLAQDIQTLALEIDHHLRSNGFESPSFSIDSPAEYPEVPEVNNARMEIVGAALDVLHLAMGPAEYLRSQALILKYDQAALAVLNDFNVWDAVPLHGSASYFDIASKTGVPEDLLRRVLRHTMTLRIFTETEQGELCHTATSATAVRRPALKSWIGHMVEEGGPAALKFVENIKKYGDGDGEPGRSPAATAFFPGQEKEKTVFEWMEEGDGWRMKRFGEAMKYASTNRVLHDSRVNQGFDWEALGEATVVDVGGSIGHFSFDLARAHPKLRFVVQDFPELEPQFDAAVPKELKDRVSYRAHDFLTPQPVRAAVYVIRNVLLNWSDKYARRIIQHLLPAMEPGNRIVVIDNVLPPKGAAPTMAVRALTSVDMHMWAMFNSKLRSAADWKKLFKEASPQFQVKNIVGTPGSRFAVIEVVLNRRK